MTQKVKIKTVGNQSIGLVLRDDGRVFFESMVATQDAEPETKRDWTAYVLFAIIQIEIVFIAVLNLLEVV